MNSLNYSGHIDKINWRKKWSMSLNFKKFKIGCHLLKQTYEKYLLDIFKSAQSIGNNVEIFNMKLF